MTESNKQNRIVKQKSNGKKGNEINTHPKNYSKNKKPVNIIYFQHFISESLILYFLIQSYLLW